MQEFAEYIKNETLTLVLEIGDPKSQMTQIVSEFDGETVTLGVERL